MGRVSGNTDTDEIFQIMQEATGELCFDIGANGGYLSEIFAGHFKTVLACEPCIESFDFLRALWQVENIIPLNIAVSDRDGEIELGVKRLTNTWGELFTGDSLSHWGPDYEKRTVPSKTMDSLAERFGFPDFVKIDTEGHEVKVLAGATKVFEHSPYFVIEVHGASLGEQCSRFLDDLKLSYKLVRHTAYRPEIGDWFNHYWLVG
jgi:FkbM family methyltransferase